MTLSKEDFLPLSIKKNQEEGVFPTSTWKEALYQLRQNPAAITSVIILTLLFAFALFAPYFSGYTYFDVNLNQTNLFPNKTHWFGTDDLGRDLFTRTAYGARISLFVGISAAFIDLIFGVLWGGIAGLSGGIIDELMMRFADILFALPYLLVVVLLTVVLGSGLVPIIIAMTIIGWISMARIVRGQVLQLRNQDYILAAKSIGASSSRILLKHLIPNSMAPILVTLTFTIPSAIFVEAFLSFIGLGVQAPMASWGTMANDGLPALRYYPWRLFFPAFFISLTMLAFNLLGDGLRDALDPKLRTGATHG